MMELNAKKFVVIAGAMLVLLFGVTAAVNVVVDPYLVFGDVNDSFLRYKETLPEIIAKAEMGRKLDYDTLYLGTTRGVSTAAQTPGPAGRGSAADCPVCR